jgi:uncharacterized protein YceK
MLITRRLVALVLLTALLTFLTGCASLLMSDQETKPDPVLTGDQSIDWNNSDEAGSSDQAVLDVPPGLTAA